jgi:branched-chain amino acid transport system permease protein
MAMSGVAFTLGSQQQFVKLPAFLANRYEVFGVSVGAYRLLIIVVCGALAAALQFVVARTRFGSQLRAAVDDPVVARGLGINVDLVFALTFAVGSGLAGLGGALGAELLGLDPTFPVKYMVYFLIVVAVGGSAGMTGPLVAALLLGIADVSGKYYLPQFGAFIIYVLMIVVLLWRPQGLFGRSAGR